MAVALDQPFCFFNQAPVEHRRGALVDAVVEPLPARVKTDLQDAVSGKRVAAFLPLLRQRLLRGETNLDRANHLRHVIRVDCACCRRIEFRQPVVQVRGPLFFRLPAQRFTKFRLLWRGGKESLDQCPQIEPGASGDDRQAVPLPDACKCLASAATVVTRRAGFIGARRRRSCGAELAAALRSSAWRCRSPSRDRRRPSRN